MTGTLYGVGVGPGDPDLLTLKAHRLIRDCDVIAYPAPDTGTSFARAIVEPFMGEGKSEIAIIVPMRVERFPAQDVYDAAAQEIAGHLDGGEDVVVLCEGDPFFYGSFMYLYQRLAGRYPCEVVPGISSIMAAGAVLGRPLAARNDVLTVVPGPSDDATIRAALISAEALAIIKVGRHLERLRNLIEDSGLLGEAAYLERVSLPNQEIRPLAQMTDAKAPYFSIILIYKGAESWIADLPLEGAQ